MIKRKSNLQEIEEEFILGYIHQIPDLALDDSGSKSRIIDLLDFSFDFGLGAYSREKRKSEKALKTVGDIRGKYACIEFMLKNYFE